jgi:N-methylhydantoinase B
VADKAGAGKYRGGVPFLRDHKFLETEGMLQVRSDRRDHRPFGLYGGSPGGPSENYLNPDGENRLLPSKLTMTVKSGDIFRHVLAGAGGWGDPLERDPAAVLRDVRNELLSPVKALADYGVAVDTKSWTVDTAATERRRVEMAKARGWTEPPKVQWHDPVPLARAAE